MYLCLPKKMRGYWNNNTIGTRTELKHSITTVVSYILENSLIDKIKERICARLETAASIVEACGLIGLAQEFRCLALPLRESYGPQEERHGRPGISLVQM